MRLLEVNQMIEKQASDLDQVEVESHSKLMHLKNIILNLTEIESFTPEHEPTLDTLRFKVDVSRNLYDTYDLNWKKSSGALVLNEAYKSLLGLVLLKWYFQNKVNNADYRVKYKLLNALIKLFSSLNEGLKNDKVEELLIAELKGLTSERQINSKSYEYEALKSNLKEENVKTVPLIVLFYEGPIARAFLETFRSLSMKPRRIVHLVSKKDLVTKKESYTWMPQFLREKARETKQKKQIHYWSQFISRKFPEIPSEIYKKIQSEFKFDEEFLEGALKLKELSCYSDHVETLSVADIKDPCLVEYLQSIEEGPILFTGGGILSENLLSISGKPFIHIHPGFLPDLRGADGVLWSYLLYDRSSATGFYMSPGIDTGDIIQSCWLPQLKLNIDEKKYDLKTIYRSVFSFFDPWVRSFVLREILLGNNTYHDMPSKTQTENEGETFHFMNPKFQELSFSKIFLSGRQSK